MTDSYDEVYRRFQANPGLFRPDAEDAFDLESEDQIQFADAAQAAVKIIWQHPDSEDPYGIRYRGFLETTLYDSPFDPSAKLVATWQAGFIAGAAYADGEDARAVLDEVLQGMNPIEFLRELEAAGFTVLTEENLPSLLENFGGEVTLDVNGECDDPECDCHDDPEARW